MATNISDIGTVHLVCRDVGHAWNLIGYWLYGADRKRLLRCTRCESEREDTLIPRYGYTLKRRYIYADGYLNDKGTVLDKSDYRAELLDRVVVADERPRD